MNALKTNYMYSVPAGSSLGLSKQCVFIGIFTISAVMLPLISHQFGMAGSIFLPMHFAVLIAALVMGFNGGIIVALVSPFLSFALSGMPPVPSLLPIAIELTVYAILLNIFVRSFKIPVIVSLILSLVIGRFVMLAPFVFLTQQVPISVKLYSLFIISLPGILIQLAIVPLISSKIINYLRK